MTETLRYYPAELLRMARVSWEIGSQLIAGGQTLSGVQPVARLDGGGLWRMTMEDVYVVDAHRRRTWRALSAICDGGVQPIIMQMRESPDAPWPEVSGVQITGFAPVPHGDDSLFSDDSGYENGVIEAHIVGAAALRATSAVIDIVAGEDLEGGEFFSIDHEEYRWRLYRIRTVSDNGDGTWNVTFRPPLRAAVADGTVLEFDHPKCVMRLATAGAMDATFESGWIAKPTISFIESFPPFPE